MASSLMELSVGGGGQTKLSIMSTLRALGIVDIGGGSVKKFKGFTGYFLWNWKTILTIQFNQNVKTECQLIH